MVKLRILHATSPQPLPRLDLHRLTDVVKVYLSAIVHKRGKCQGFAARTCAVVKNGLLGPSVDPHGQELACLVLHLEVAFFELDQLKEVALGRSDKSDPVRRELGWFGPPAQLFELFEQFLPSRADRVRPDSQLCLLVHDSADSESLRLAVGLLDQVEQFFVLADLDMIWHRAFLLRWLLSLSLKFFTLICIQPIVPVHWLLAKIA